MRPTEPSSLAASHTFANGTVTFVLAQAESIAPDEVIELYAEDHLIGSAPLEVDSQSKRAEISVTDLPALPFPLVLRAQTRSARAELAPPVVVSDLMALLRAMGKPSAELRLIGVEPEKIVFEARFASLGNYPRELNLLVDGALVCTSQSRVTTAGPTREARHEVAFQASTPLREGMVVGVACAASGHTLYSAALSWMDLLSAALYSARQTAASLDELQKAHERLAGRFEALANFGRERLLLERLDLYYLSLNERIDRVLELVSPEGRVPRAPGSAAEESARRDFRPSELEGAGIHALESEGGHEWRWFGPNVSLLFRDVPARPATITLEFHTFGEGIAEPRIDATVNSVEVAPSVKRREGGGWTVAVPVPTGAHQPDRALILNVRFGHSHSTPQDSRVLSAVFTGGAILPAA
jgi:hypothetical protein